MQDWLSPPADLWHFSQVIFFMGLNGCRCDTSLTVRERHVFNGRTVKKQRKLKAGTALLSLQ